MFESVFEEMITKQRMRMNKKKRKLQPVLRRQHIGRSVFLCRSGSRISAGMKRMENKSMNG